MSAYALHYMALGAAIMNGIIVGWGILSPKMPRLDFNLTVFMFCVCIVGFVATLGK
jgi:hypothetical protein